MSWVTNGPDEFGCGNVERVDNGWIYEAQIVVWNVNQKRPRNEFNNFQDAEAFVEQWCKP